MFKSFIQKRLENYVTKYFQKHPEVKLIVVTGSIGKTSTKRALADILTQRYRVRMHEGNHNTDIAAPVAVLGLKYPDNIRNPLSWISVFRAASARIKSPTDVDVIIQELGIDRPGDMANFGRYLRPDLAVVTAVTPEHMEFFKSLDIIAQEELSVSQFSQFTLINRDDIDGKYAAFENTPAFSTYGTNGLAEFHYEQESFDPENGGSRGKIVTPNNQPYDVALNVVGEHSVRPLMGAVAAATYLGLTPADIIAGLALVRPVPGRMNPLKGPNGALIIDDTYNSSPAAATAAIEALYQFDAAPQRIAILGSMNELGETSQVEHERLGYMCDPGKLAWVIVVGEEAKRWLSPAARSRGCQVKDCRDAIEAGEFARSVQEENSVILVKGSQGGVYLEEAVKILCNMDEDAELVRQSPQWMKIKEEYFTRFK